MSQRARVQLQLTRRALRDIEEIHRYSVEHWGEDVAGGYLDEIEAGLVRLKEHPDLLQPVSDFHPALRFYRVNKHWIVCDAQPKSIIVLTVIHSSMDLPSRLSELQPTLAVEAEILHRRLRPRGSR